MASKTCPLCGGKLKNNYCESCGYDVPESEELSALYNYDPSDYPQPQNEPAPIREMYPDRVDVEEIYPNRPEPMKFKVRNDDGKTVKGTYTNKAQTPAQNKPQTPYANNANNANRQQNPYAMPYVNQQNPPARNMPAQNNNPYANINPYQQTNQNAQANDLKEVCRKYWWLLLICFLVPVAGIIVLSAMKRTLDKRYTWIFMLAIILGIFLPP